MALLCVGPIGSGKTVLLDRLQQSTIPSSKPVNIDATSDPPITVPTTGTTLTTINLLSPDYKKSKWKLSAAHHSTTNEPTSCTIREVGGQMAPIWSNYFSGKDNAPLDGVIYVMDASDPMQISCSSILLLKTLSDPKLRSTPFLICLNKVDIFNCSTVENTTQRSSWTLEESKFLLRLDDICIHASQQISVIETSFSGDNSDLDLIKEWLRKTIQTTQEST